MSSCFCTKPVAPNSAPPDPGKHVNYAQGMVLGVDDFTQEFAYLSGRDRWLARDAIGYGTLRGLALSWMKDKVGKLQPKVMVTSGTALTPCGQLVCVSSDQCADINQWLAPKERDAEIASRLEAGSKLTLHVTLAYSDCPTDDIPIPGEPCRSAEDLMQPSRITDSFQLELSWDAPLQAEEDALRGFFAWLRKLALVKDSDPSTPLADFMAEVRKWNEDDTDPASIKINTSKVSLYASTAMRLWVTELRPDVERGAAWRRFDSWLNSIPVDSTGAINEEKFLAEVRRWTPGTYSWPDKWAAKTSAEKDALINKAHALWGTEIVPKWYGESCGCRSSGNGGYCDDRLLLGTISFRVEKTAGNPWRVVIPEPPTAESPTVDESRRPVLIHLRALEAQLIPLPDPGFAGANPTASPQVAPFRRVAMGRVKSSSGTAPVFGNVRITGIKEGEVRFTFNGYTKPDNKHDYVVQALGSYTGSKSEPAVRFAGFDDQDFLYKITRSGKGVAKSELEIMEFQVEVTLIVKPN